MPKRFLIGAILFFTLSAVGCAGPAMAQMVPADPSAASDYVSTAVTFTPTADAYVSALYPTANYGTASQLRADGSPVTTSYLRFSVSGLGGSVAQATLRVYANSALDTGIAARRVVSNTWSESTLTYDNAPAPGTLIASSNVISANTWVTWDVSSYVVGNGTYSFALSSSNLTALSMASREATNKPQLVIAVNASSSPTPTRSSTVQPSATPTGSATVQPSSTPTAIATPNATIKPSPTPTRAADPVIVGAGDIVICGQPGAEETAKLLDHIAGQVITLGDNSNEQGTAAQYADCYDPTWGRQKARTRPAVGNHDYLTDNGTPFFQYFGSAIPSRGYYSYNLGAWHIIVLNSECSHTGGCQSGSTQEQWLKADLAAHPSKCILTYWHEPRFSSGQWGSHDRYDAFWRDLYAAHADIVLNGHDHDYERFGLQNPSEQADPNGIREFVVGTGGASHGPFNAILPNSQVRNNNTFGVIQFTLHSASYDWKFLPVAGQSFTDSGSEACR